MLLVAWAASSRPWSWGATYDEQAHSYTIGLVLLLITAAAALLFVLLRLRDRNTTQAPLPGFLITRCLPDETRWAPNEKDTVEKTSLTALVRQHLALAAAASSGRSAHTVYGGHEHTLRQTMIALAAGRALDDHENPGEATLQVLHGRVRLTTADEQDVTEPNTTKKKTSIA